MIVQATSVCTAASRLRFDSDHEFARIVYREHDDDEILRDPTEISKLRWKQFRTGPNDSVDNQP